ncbi:ATP-binding response regulator [Asticcacaulis excentricus]|uniref:histidine kinase n=1 Tax=Asticcacaulis excentricus (strain ATCC 15261 / DSM 4724 / KCTC 12464 / NCIMB 9791 / VKM B-1370 / CB 48) TaxID=573065 RepID=E8RQ95_ASTEC|nr:HAMP domain-containing sensor histidine kinase [Asticcacaulis excentricus]ADU13197.1 integral membrane sensor signal transduction histidine kinase [Asticcacaulis excentricus CB 48]
MSEPTSPSYAEAEVVLTQEQIALDYGLKAQVRLLPYALGFFAIGLPVYIWGANYFMSPLYIAQNIGLFVCVWAAFFLLKPSLKTDARPTRQSLNVRLRRQWLCGALWSLSLLAASLNCIGGGQAAQVFATICAGAAVGIIFFSAPVLLFLLTLAPLAMAGPILALNLTHPDGAWTSLITGGLAMALALGLIMNRHLQEHYQLAFAQLRTLEEREAARTARDALTRDQMALMKTLSREIATGLRSVDQTLGQGLSHLSRAPAPRHYVESARSEIDHLLGLITTTLDEGEARSGQMVLDLRPLDIEGLVREVTAGFQEMADARGLDLTLTLPPRPDAGAAIGDAPRVEQILSHLLANALQYTPKGKVEVRLLPPSDGHLRVEVVDSGPGLEPDELHRAFLPHERIARTSAGYSGAGLGLNLSRRLAELMYGNVEAQSTPDVGSKFWLELPFDPTAIPPRLIDEAVTPVAESVSGLKVMLVSNDSLRSVELRDTLEGLGHRCLTATTRPRAVSLAAKGDIDAVLIATGAFEDLDNAANRQKVGEWLERLRATQTRETLNILALLPDGQQAEPLSEMGVRPLLIPQTEDALRRALSA